MKGKRLGGWKPQLEDELFTRCSLLVANYSLLVTRYLLLVARFLLVVFFTRCIFYSLHFLLVAIFYSLRIFTITLYWFCIWFAMFY